MLQRLFVQNIVTIEKQVIEFQSGFSVVTGETGAGKSVIIKSIALILGEKGTKNLIRSGENFLLVEGVFDISNNPVVQNLLEEHGIEHENELTLRRKISLSGKNKIYINELSSTLTLLSQIGAFLIDMHGQHAQQSLLSTSNHLFYLDKFARLEKKRKEFEELYRQYKKKLQHQKELESALKSREQRLDFIQFQWEEIEKSQLSIEEERQLREEVTQLNYGDQLREWVGEIASWGEEEFSPLSSLSSALSQIEKAAEIDKQLEKPREDLNTVFFTLEETVKWLTHYISSLEVDPHRLEIVNKRLSDIETLKRKYGKTLEDIFSFQKNLRQEIVKLKGLERNHGKIAEELKNSTIILQKNADILSQERKKKIHSLEKLILKELHELGLKGCQFEIQLRSIENEFENPEFYLNGIDQVVFRIATNPGNSLEPLSKIISGGELSRVMLAIKTVLQESHSLSTMIFDEIDTGISGRIAETVGQKIRELSKIKQIICITHLPQIASLANFHLKVEKNSSEGYTKTKITAIEEEERVMEIARFIGGAELTEKTLLAAKEMLTI